MNSPLVPAPQQAKRVMSSFMTALAFVAVLALPELAFAGTASGFEDDACEFVGSISNLLTIASVAVVTIAIIFAGYQIAFAHKRIADVAPILIGGLLIGAAGQLAQWLLTQGGDGSAEDCTAMLIQAAGYIA